jgi:hypothetical protein
MIGASTAPFGAESQSFLDNIVAQFPDVRAWKWPRTPTSLHKQVANGADRQEESSSAAARDEMNSYRVFTPSSVKT